MADRSASLAFILSLTDKITAPLGRVKMGFSDLAEQSQKGITQMGVGLAGVTGAFYGISASLEPALEMNRALGEVRSLGVAEDALEALNRKSMEFSVAYGENARDFVASAYSIEGAIKGMTGEQLATFTNASNLLAKATKSDASTMGNYVGTMYNLFKGQADAMGKGAWVDQLTGQTATAVKLFRTSGDQIGEAFKSAGGLASTAGVSLAEQMAVLGTLGSTIDGGEAGGLYKAFFENISGASTKLGMKFVDQQGKLLPMLDILDKLKGKFGDLSIEANGNKLRDAFGGEAARLISTLMADTDRLKNGMDQLGGVRGLENAEKMAKDMVDPWQQWTSLVQGMRTLFGQVLIPTVTPFMEKLVDIGKVLMRWTQLFPNITRVVGVTTLAILGIIASMSLLTFAVGVGRVTWLGMLTVWKLLTWTGFRSIAMFLYHTVMVVGFVAGLALMYTWMGLVRVGMLLWQGAIWLVNAALLANPIVWIVIAIVALVAAVIAAVVYWDEWTTALMNSEAFKWVSEQFQKLSDWFSSMGGWSGLAQAAWDGIVNIFKRAINGLVEMMNKIPGVQIDAIFSDLPQTPELPNIAAPKVDTPQVPPLVSTQQLMSVQPPLMMAAAPLAPAPAMMPPKALEAPLQPPALVMAPTPVEQAEQTQQRVNRSITNLSPERPNAVPRGGLLSSIQNNNQTQNKGTHVENLNIHTAKPMSPLELENMMSMAVGG
ncbi:phage tail tape measure protein [Pseudomonas gingeri]|uniref:Phage tail tape measure protein n=1 Tax=Pseudomonas gingeri TaxID=117681 RepID=A0A7Y7XHX2_9PSED|nr:phage tail tape measure protein [Pseudomonas gingeri]NWB99087.1 phage tail tape measure protein [Pseudomonas gingeri]